MPENMKSESVSFSRFILWQEGEFVKRLASHIRIRMFLTPTTPAEFAYTFGLPCLN